MSKTLRARITGLQGINFAGAMVLVGFGSWLIGYALAGTNRGGRLGVGIGTSFRNSALALLIAASMGQRLIITGVIAFLAGDGASYITATTIFADGGIMQSSPGF